MGTGVKKCPIKGIYIILFKGTFLHFKLTVVHCQNVILIFILGNLYFWRVNFIAHIGTVITVWYDTVKAEVFTVEKKKVSGIFTFPQNTPYSLSSSFLKMFYPAVQWISIRHPSSVVYCTIPSAFHSAAKPMPSEIMDSLIHSFIHSFIRNVLKIETWPGIPYISTLWNK